jgi:hypothetical protein
MRNAEKTKSRRIGNQNLRYLEHLSGTQMGSFGPTILNEKISYQCTFTDQDEVRTLTT